MMIHTTTTDCHKPVESQSEFFVLAHFIFNGINRFIIFFFAELNLYLMNNCMIDPDRKFYHNRYRFTFSFNFFCLINNCNMT